MTTYLGKSCSFCLPRVEGRIWDLIVSVPDHCLSFYSVLLFSVKEDKNGLNANFQDFQLFFIYLFILFFLYVCVFSISLYHFCINDSSLF